MSQGRVVDELALARTSGQIRTDGRAALARLLAAYSEVRELASRFRLQERRPGDHYAP